MLSPLFAFILLSLIPFCMHWKSYDEMMVKFHFHLIKRIIETRIQLCEFWMGNYLFSINLNWKLIRYGCVRASVWLVCLFVCLLAYTHFLVAVFTFKFDSPVRFVVSVRQFLDFSSDFQNHIIQFWKRKKETEKTWKFDKIKIKKSKLKYYIWLWNVFTLFKLNRKEK